MVELVYAADLKSAVERHMGSSPIPGTTIKELMMFDFLFIGLLSAAAAYMVVSALLSFVFVVVAGYVVWRLAR